jgi:hypothetical protein
MKVRSAAILFAVLLTTSALTATIAWADAPMAPVTPAVATPAAPAPAAAPCGGNSSSLFNIESVAPVSKDTLTCGSCSVPLCRGVAYNSVCGSPRYPATCVAALGNDCSLGVPQCQCWSVGAPFP